MIVTRLNELDFSVTGPFGRHDGCMRFAADGLRSFEQKGDVRIGGLMRVTLGLKSDARIRAMAIGEAVEFKVVVEKI